MAVDKPISELNPAGELSGSEPVAIVQGGETVRTTTEEIANKATAFMVSNEVYTLEVQNDDLSGTGSIESQLVAYILALPALQRTILKTQSKWNVRLLNGAQLLSIHEIVGKGIGVISTLGVANLQLIYEAGASGVNEFTELLDTPNSYTGQAGKVVKVNSTEDGLEFADETGGVGNLQSVTDNGSTTTNPITAFQLSTSDGVVERLVADEAGAVFGTSFQIRDSNPLVGEYKDILMGDTTSGQYPQFELPNKNTGVYKIATEDWALQRDGSNANSDVDLGAFNLNAKGVKINGTAGAGHLGLKHQSANATAGGQETVIFAGSDGEPRYKNDGGAIEQFASRAWVLAQGFITNVISALGYTPANRAGDTFTGNITATNLSGTNTGDETTSTIQTKRPIKTVASQSLEGVGNISLSKSDVGLGNVDNTSDLNKPISTATQTALNGKVTLNTWVDISLTSTVTGFSSFTTRQIQYLIIGNQGTLVCNLIGTSNSGLLEFDLPFNIGGRGCVSISARTQNSGSVQNTAGFVLISANSNLVQVFLNASQAPFANSGTKSAQFTVTFNL